VLPVPVGAGPGFTPNTTGEHRITNLGTIGPKLGFAFDRFMIYGTGGFALAEVQGSYCSSITGQCGFPLTVQAGKSWNPGWFAGVGVDYMVHKGPMFDVILGAEYQHYDLRSERTFCFNSNCGAPTGADYDTSARGDLFRAKLTIKYNPWPVSGPIVARY
jgi:outer membrane immunogenic protein